MEEANITINSTIEYIKNSTYQIINENENMNINMENIQNLNMQNQTDSQRNFYTILFLIITIAFIIKKFRKFKLK
jgi:hypothetical protein